MPIAWTVKDSKGELLPGFIAGSRREVAQKIVPARYDAFRLEVSPSYREMFDRDLKTVLARAVRGTDRQFAAMQQLRLQCEGRADNE